VCRSWGFVGKRKEWCAFTASERIPGWGIEAGKI